MQNQPMAVLATWGRDAPSADYAAAVPFRSPVAPALAEAAAHALSLHSTTLSSCISGGLTTHGWGLASNITAAVIVPRHN